MRRVRVIPLLLIQNGGLVKSIKFKGHTYVGDPINAVKIFNEKEVDEIVILDISAGVEKRGPNMQQVKELTSEAFMPMGYGGGITKLEEIKELVRAGVEKVILNTAAFYDPQLVADAATYLGSQSIVVSIDTRKNLWGKYKVYTNNGTVNTRMNPVEYAIKMEAAGAGELLINAIDKDGTFEGYDINLLKMVSSSVGIPVVIIGGASDIKDLAEGVRNGASAVSAGSMFIFQRPHRAVLISYPSQEDLKEKLFNLIH